MLIGLGWQFQRSKWTSCSCKYSAVERVCLVDMISWWYIILLCSSCHILSFVICLRKVQMLKTVTHLMRESSLTTDVESICCVECSLFHCRWFRSPQWYVLYDVLSRLSGCTDSLGRLRLFNLVLPLQCGESLVFFQSCIIWCWPLVPEEDP